MVLSAYCLLEGNFLILVFPHCSRGEETAMSSELMNCLAKPDLAVDGARPGLVSSGGDPGAGWVRKTRGRERRRGAVADRPGPG